MNSSPVDSDACDELRQALKYAKSFEETLEKYKEILISFEDSGSGEECSLAAHTLCLNYLAQVVSFGQRALTKVTTNNDGTDKSCVLVSSVLRLLGFAYLHLQRFDVSLSYLTQAESNLSKLDQKDFVLDTALNIQMDFYNLKKAMGRNLDVIVHAKKALEIKEKIMEEGCVELGKANQVVSEAYFEDFFESEINFKEAVPYCLKAKEIYTKHLGPDSVEVAKVMRGLCVIYHRSGEIENALAQNRLAASVLKKTAPNSHELRTTEADCVNMLMTMGRFEEAIDILKGLLQHNDAKEEERAILTLAMSQALFYLEHFADAKSCMEKAQGMLMKNRMEPLLVASAFADMSIMYEVMNDLDNAILLTKGVLAVPGLPQELFQEHSVRIFLLMSQSGKDTEEIQYMESVVKKLNEFLAPHHLTLLKLSHILSVAYAGLGRFHQALGVEEKVAKGLNGLPPSELGFIHAVTEHLNKMRDRVAESPAAASCQSKDEGLSAKSSKSGVSDDGEVFK